MRLHELSIQKDGLKQLESGHLKRESGSTQKKTRFWSNLLMNPYHDGSVVTTGFMTSYLTITAGELEYNIPVEANYEKYWKAL
jgi:hypothetical protein